MKSWTRTDGAGRRARRMLRTCSTAVLALSLMLAVPVGAQGQRGPSKREDLVAKLAGKKVRVDRATGQLREMTTDEARDFVDHIANLTDPARIDATPVVAVTSGFMKRLGDHAGHVVVARPNADGSTSSQCVADVDEAVAFLAGDTSDLQ